MIIKELTLVNFCCYYDVNIFELSENLNIILGHNGDGKTTIFTAFKWLFNPTYSIDYKDLISAKKLSETSEGSNFDVKVVIKVEQYDEQVTIEKGFSVKKKENGYDLTPMRESAFVKNLITGEGNVDKDSRSLLNRIFPPEYRNFSMFETETETLNLVNRTQLANLVNSFSNAKIYENIEGKASFLYDKAEKAFISQSKADKKTRDKIEGLDKDIEYHQREINRLEYLIEEDKNGLKVYEDTLDDLARNSSLSQELQKINEEIKDLEREKSDTQKLIKNKYSHYLFDRSFILAGYEKFSLEFSDKIDSLRRDRNRIEDEEKSEYIEHHLKLSLVNGAIPLPAGSPSRKILHEFLEENICKICGRTLDQESTNYINKSLKISENPITGKGLEQDIPAIFPNIFIKELELLDSTLSIQNKRSNILEVKKDIQDLIENNEQYGDKIKKIEIQLLELGRKKEDILNQTTTSEDQLNNVILNLKAARGQRDRVSDNIMRNEILLKSEIESLTNLKNNKRKTLEQLPPSTFKSETIEILDDIRRIFAKTKEREYDRFLEILQKKATKYLKLINPGEVTGIIELVRTGKEVIYRSLNEDRSLRSKLDNSGALEISIPMAILFAIAELASDLRNESYPMIFDAPTGRFSDDRTIAFYDAIHKMNKQYIIVTKEFLGVDEEGCPYPKKEFSRVTRDKAFWIVRERPFDLNKKETINTSIKTKELEEL